MSLTTQGKWAALPLWALRSLGSLASPGAKSCPRCLLLSPTASAVPAHSWDPEPALSWGQPMASQLSPRVPWQASRIAGSRGSELGGAGAELGAPLPSSGHSLRGSRSSCGASPASVELPSPQLLQAPPTPSAEFANIPEGQGGELGAPARENIGCS